MKTASGRARVVLALWLAGCALLAGCQVARLPATATPAPSDTATVSPTATRTPTPTALPTLPTPTPSPASSSTPTLPPPPTPTPSATAAPRRTATPSVTPTDLLRRVTLGGSLSSLRRGGKVIWSAVRLECLDATGAVLARLNVKALRDNYRLPGGTSRVALWIGPELGGADVAETVVLPAGRREQGVITLVIRALATPTRPRTFGASRTPTPPTRTPTSAPPTGTSTPLPTVTLTALPSATSTSIPHISLTDTVTPEPLAHRYPAAAATPTVGTTPS